MLIADEKLIAQLCDKLTQHKFEFYPGRVPYTYHHDACKIATTVSGVSRSGVASALSNACGEDNELYTAELILGTLSYFAEYHPHQLLICIFIDTELRELVETCRKTLADRGKTLFWFKEDIQDD